MDRKMNHLQETLETLANENRTNVKVRLKQAEDELKSKFDKERLMMMKTKSQLQEEVARLRCLTKELVSWTSFRNELRIVLVGKTGVGKSETGNTIVGEEIFEADPDFTSVTKKCKEHSFTRNGQKLQVVDVPGFVDTELSKEDIKTEVMRCVGLSHPGIHAILFVIEMGRFTDDDVKTLDEFCRCFGKESMKYVIVIFTKIDSLKKKKTLQQVLKSAPHALTSFLAKVNDRYLGVNNMSEYESEKEYFFNNLLSMVRSLVEANGGTCYTNAMYKNATQMLEEEMKREIKRLAEQGRKRDEELLGRNYEEYERKVKQMGRTSLKLMHHSRR